MEYILGGGSRKIEKVKRHQVRGEIKKQDDRGSHKKKKGARIRPRKSDARADLYLNERDGS
jgi:hypothetical protein